MNKKGTEGSIWTIIVAIIALVVLVIVIWVFRDQIMRGYESFLNILNGVHSSIEELNISKIVK